MNEPASTGPSPGSTTTADETPTAAQTALLLYLNALPAEPITRTQADGLISQLEADPDWQPHLQAWHRDKRGLHPELFAVPQRSFREARWWQSQVSDGNLFGYSFRQPSVNQALVILESLDGQLPGWDKEGKKRRVHRFMNELATLSPELCKPGCAFPHDLPEEGDETEDAPPAPAFSAPSAPFVPDVYAARSAPPASQGKPAWDPPVQPPLQAAAAAQAAPRRGGMAKWALGLLLLAAAAGAYGYFGFRTSAPVRGDVAASTPAASAPAGKPSPPAAIPPSKALDSQRRAMEIYPDLARAGTPLNKTFVAMVKQLQIENSPRLQQPDWPEEVAAQCAKALLITPLPRKVAPAAAPPSAPRPQAVAAMPTAPVAAAPPATVSPAAAATPSMAPVKAAFISLEAAYKEKLNTIRYHEHGVPQEATVQVDLRSMMHDSAKFVVRCVFFKRPTGRGDLRSVLSKEDKHVELTGGQSFSDSFVSPPVYRGRGATEEFDGWLVQLIPEGGDRFIKQLGSTGTIEELGKTMKD